MKTTIEQHRKLLILVAAVALMWLNRHSGFTPQEMLSYFEYALQLLAIVGVYQLPNAPKSA